ncbi:acetylcholine receptor subunit delta-like [Liolophura sinensis]|uniref:acetylcholine receptor subunit delta-like n=1 Tax=Liolophura sinensis TaxID=3198878 RepID=UPI003158BFAC
MADSQFTVEEGNERLHHAPKRWYRLVAAVIVWGGICGEERTPLVIIYGNLTPQHYVDEILRPVVLVGSINTPVQTEQNKIIVNDDGAIEWDAEGTFRVSCPVEMVRFPFDEQSCPINISNNKYTIREVNPTIQNYSTSGVVFNNGQWKILDLFVTNWYDDDGYKYMGFHIRTRRRPSFYVMNMVLPSLVLTVLGNCLYLIPPHISDRVAVGTTLVLAYTVFMIQVTDGIPGSFRNVPYITIFFLVAMVMSALVVVISILVLRLSQPIVSGTTATLPIKEKLELYWKQASRAKLVHRVDVTFFLLHLTVLLGLCSTVVFFALE